MADIHPAFDRIRCRFYQSPGKRKSVGFSFYGDIDVFPNYFFRDISGYVVVG
jgi:hypothetical protein